MLRYPVCKCLVSVSLAKGGLAVGMTSGSCHPKHDMLTLQCGTMLAGQTFTSMKKFISYYNQGAAASHLPSFEEELNRMVRER